jgi:mono/diheme cytochrome c family protein
VLTKLIIKHFNDSIQQIFALLIELCKNYKPLKMDFQKFNIRGSFLLLAIILLASCQSSKGDKTGSEYMPDMAHSVAYEANVYTYYGLNTWGEKEDYHTYAQPRLPVNGTVARGAFESDDLFTLPKVNSVPYHYADNDDDRERAIAEIIVNPYPISDENLKMGKELYEIFCGICHGPKADGGGYLARDDGGKYPVVPANLLLDEHVEASVGRIYHSIMYGKGLMGAYKDKLNYKERWQVIHYIRSLQAASVNKEYNASVNEFRSSEAAPAGKPVSADETVFVD